jgi:NDP-sugar pyrophosphorylase family protein
MNGDLVTQADVGAMIDAHEGAGATQAITLGVRRYVHHVPYGCVDQDENGRVSQVQEKPTLSVLVNAGIYVVEPYVITGIPYGEPASMPELLEKWDTVAYEVMDDWLDVGQHDQLRLARGAA